MTRYAFPGSAFGSQAASAPSPIASKATLTLGFVSIASLRSSAVMPYLEKFASVMQTTKKSSESLSAQSATPWVILWVLTVRLTKREDPNHARTLPRCGLRPRRTEESPPSSG